VGVRKGLIVVMIAVAVAVFWSLFTTGEKEPSSNPLAALSLDEEGGMTLHGVKLVEKKNNINTMELLATKASVTGDGATERTALTRFSVVSRSVDYGAVSFSAARGSISGNNKQVTAIGAVTLRDDKERTLITDSLYLNNDTRRVTTDDMVWIYGDGFLLHGRGLTANLDTEQVEIRNDVVAIFKAREE